MCTFSTLSAFALTACSGNAETTNVAEIQPDMGSATAATSPKATNPEGIVLKRSAIDALQAVGNSIGIKMGSHLELGSASDFEKDNTTKVSIDAECFDMTSNAKAFIVACSDGVHSVDPVSGKDSVIAHPTETAHYAVQVSTGEVIIAHRDSNKVEVFNHGEKLSETATEYGSDQLVSVPIEGHDDAVVRINNKYTLIQDVNWKESKPGAILRVGKGVGRISAAEQGVVLASDAKKNQFAVYGAKDVIRLHQTSPTGPSPWGIAWDHKHDMAWVATTGDNKVTGYDISSGTGSEKSSYNTIENVHNIAVLDDGTLVLASASGAGLQLLKSQAD